MFVYPVDINSNNKEMRKIEKSVFLWDFQSFPNNTNLKIFLSEESIEEVHSVDMIS